MDRPLNRRQNSQSHLRGQQSSHLRVVAKCGQKYIFSNGGSHSFQKQHATRESALAQVHSTSTTDALDDRLDPFTGRRNKSIRKRKWRGNFKRKLQAQISMKRAILEKFFHAVTPSAKCDGDKE